MTRRHRLCSNTTAAEIINHGQTRETRFLATIERSRTLRAAGYPAIEKWGCDDQNTQERQPKTKQEPTRTQSSMIWNRNKKNAEKRVHNSSHVWKRACTGFGEHWRHAWTRAQAYLRRKPKRAYKEVNGRTREPREKHSSCIEGIVHARRCLPVHRKVAYGAIGMVRPGACSRFQLRALTWIWSKKISQSC